MSPQVQLLLTLQTRDQTVAACQAELDRVPREEAALDEKLAARRAQLEQVKGKARQLETERKQLDLEVKGKEAQMARYQQQQLQTRKNEEYAALGNEIEHAKADI